MTSDAHSTKTEFADLLTQHAEHGLQSKGYPTMPYEDAAWGSHPTTRSAIPFILPTDAQTEKTTIEKVTEMLLSYLLESPGHYNLVGVNLAGPGTSSTSIIKGSSLLIKTSP